MADIATSEIQLYGLPTKTVNLTPTGGTVVREITTKIQPGLNGITLLGLDHRVDVDSIRIEGSGPATITDIQTEIVPRRELFEDVYEEEESDDDSTDGGEEDPKLTGLKAARAATEERLEKAWNDEKIALQVLKFMDSYGKNMQPQHTESSNLDAFIDRYIERCATEDERRYKARVQASKEAKEMDSLSEKIQNLELRSKRARDKARRDREHAQGKSQEIRKRQERRHFWAHSVAQVTVHLDSHSFSTPGSSRRSSISVVERAANKPEDPIDEKEIMLRLSYVVPDAKWVSRYELSINTPSSTAQLTYGAEFQNQSSETWSDARVTLSTSQSSFSGLHESIPPLQVWHVKLTGSSDGNEQPSWENIVRSLAEGGGPVLGGFKDNNLQDYQMQLMLLEPQNKRRLIMARQDQDQQGPQQMQLAQQAHGQQGLQQMQLAQQAPPQPGSDPFAQQMRAAPARPNQAAPQLHQGSAGSVVPPDPYHEGNDEEEILSPPNLEHQDSVRQQYGLTTTYDLPGRRTLVPSSVNRRHTLAKLDFKSLTLQHVIVPKHRAAAFFRARIRNTSSIQILRGRVGMTVDGAFLGTTNMPNSAPNDYFDISMGVDPSILVTYAKPTVRRETSSGFFAKDDTAIFRRRCWVKNTKSIAANIIVMDQVPMSNDEKLQMDILEPKALALAKEGDKVPMAMEADKGKGVVILGKDGEVKWVVQLEPGKDVRMVLEYEMRAPTGNDVIPS